MKQFAQVYKKASDVAQAQTFAEPDWNTFLSTTCGMRTLFGVNGLDAAKANATDEIRKKIKDAAKSTKFEKAAFSKAAGKVIFDACQNTRSAGTWKERAAVLTFLRHLYRAQKKGAQDVWVYSPLKAHASAVFDEFSGDEATVKKKLGQEDEIFTAKERDLMCSALHLARKVAMDAVVKLGAKEQATKDMVRAWFLAPGDSDATLDDCIKKLNEGMKKIAASCDSTSLVFTDYLDWRKDRKKYFGAAFPGGEGGGFPIIYLEGAFTRLSGNSGKLWLCAETIVHELSHHDVRTKDHQYDHEGLKPGASFPSAKAIDNADSWGYFTIDLAGYLSKSDRKKVLK